MTEQLRGELQEKKVNLQISKGKNYLFVIAIDAYERHRCSTGRVEAVKRLVNILQNNYSFPIEFPYFHWLYDEDATRASIFAHFDYLIDTLRPEDRLLLVFAGHGHRHFISQEIYWLPYEATIPMNNTHFKLSYVLEFMEEVKANQICLLNAAPFSLELEQEVQAISDSNGKYYTVLTCNEQGIFESRKTMTSTPFFASLNTYLEANKSLNTLALEVLNAYAKRNKPVFEPVVTKKLKGKEQNILVCWSHGEEDETLKIKLLMQLKSLTRVKPKLVNKILENRMVRLGENLAKYSQKQLEIFAITLLLISPEFTSNDDIWFYDYSAALQKHEEGATRVVPIILRACYWKEFEFVKLEVLPRGGKAIGSAENIEEVMSEIVEEIAKLLNAKT